MLLATTVLSMRNCFNIRHRKTLSTLKPDRPTGLIDLTTKSFLMIESISGCLSNMKESCFSRKPISCFVSANFSAYYPFIFTGLIINAPITGVHYESSDITTKTNLVRSR